MTSRWNGLKRQRQKFGCLILGLALSGTAWAEPSLSLPDPKLSLGGSQNEFHFSLEQKDRLEPSTALVVADAGERSSLSLDDLGFSKEETQSDPQFQKQLETRTDMLKIHQTLGLITCVPMVTNYIIGLTGGAKDDLLLHGTIGFSTAGLYLTTASFAIFAPHPKGMKASGNSELHQILAIVHGVCMVATPILGELGEDNDTFKTLHFISATGLVASFVTAMAVMTF